MTADGGDARASRGRLQALLVVLEQERFALPMQAVVEILPAVAWASLPTAPEVVAGVINLRGAPLPVLDLRLRLGLRPRPPRAEDHVVVCRVGNRTVGVWLDHVEGLTEIDRGALVPVTEVADARHVDGVALLPDGTVVVCDVRSFLSADEALRLDDAMSESTVGAFA